ncbi:hypothetical protein P154DRAFT_525963 [Amniculicola lignicola CBS 123094]|uniref:N-acetyltransferase domain-containing protein n=1 Tax=Amniculicola lignicola CBS 123094 TaxID=1392246 RepID=A0A6A5W2A1_9PLEO|nr:hypothetical protein P154DRAFT_525963 [Amniculicola lignicola CBS 123094]
MPLKLEPMTTSDSLTWTRIRVLAYTGPTNTLIHTTPPSEDTILKVAEDRQREIGRCRPNVWYLKLIDTDLSPSESDPEDNGGRTIAFGIWSLVNMDLNTKSEEEIEEPNELASMPGRTTAVESNSGQNPKVLSEATPFIPPELRVDVLNALLNPLRVAKRGIMDSKPYMMLNSLATHPDHERRGAGSMIVKWGVEKADELNIETYLNSSKIARPLYERHGFVLVEGVEFDRTVWGGEGIDWHGCMVRGRRVVGR